MSRPSSSTSIPPSSDVSNNFRPYQNGIVQQGLLCNRRQVKGLIFGEDVTSWLIGLRPHEWTSLSVFGSVNNEWSAAIDTAWGTKLSFLSSLSNIDDDIDLSLGSCFSKDLPLVSQRFLHLPMILYLVDGLQSTPLPVGFTHLVIKHATVGGVTDFEATFLF